MAIRKSINFLFVRHKWKTRLVLVSLLIWYWLCLPSVLFNDPVSTVVEDRDGNLMGARIASDGQWRFPSGDSLPDKFKKALLIFEDKRFYGHAGVDMISFFRAMGQNISSGEVVSGGSTLTMQVIRMMRKGNRHLGNKIIEAIIATRLELSYSKDEILQLYAANAPFGGNVVGLEAAAWRYFGRTPEMLSWAESATLAVLPNSPSLIHPGKNRVALKAKRNRLLDRILEHGLIDSLDCTLAKQEPLPEKPSPLPNLASRLIDQYNLSNIRPQKDGTWAKNTRHLTTLDGHLQDRAEQVVNIHHRRLRQNGIHNAAAIIADVETGDVLAYVGNTPTELPEFGGAVDIIPSRRSTGSILKPFLYAAALDAGELLPGTLLEDIPSYFGGYSPKNYDNNFDGAVPAKEALSRSLNVPAVRLLHDFGHVRFYDLLKQMGMSTLDQGADHYGLSMVLGGAEASLWDLAGMYASMARIINQYKDYGGNYDINVVRPLNTDLLKSRSSINGYEPLLTEQSLLGAGACYLIMDALLEVSRPDVEGHWRNFNSTRKVAWKTGTSFGFRDAWAIGCTPSYVIAVWAGNADGEGRPGLTGLTAAAPLLFDLFDLLKSNNEWFDPPFEELVEASICTESGHRALDHCTTKELQWIPKTGLRTQACPYHKLVHLDATGQFRVHSDCEDPSAMQHTAWFVLPPAQESFYRQKHVSYRDIPPFRADCEPLAEAAAADRNMELIYPRTPTKIYVPTDLDGKPSSTIFEVAHRNSNTKVYWHLDRQYLGQTKYFHQMALNPPVGKHTLTLVDEDGEELKQTFEILGKE